MIGAYVKLDDHVYSRFDCSSLWLVLNHTVLVTNPVDEYFDFEEEI